MRTISSSSMMRLAGAPAAPCAPRAAAPARARRAATVVRASADTEGVQDLLARDRRRKQIELAPELQLPPPQPQQQAEEPGAEEGGRRGGRFKSRAQRRREMAASEGAAGDKGPKRCKEAIDAGLALFQQQQYQAAIDSFNLALELPGNGAYRLPGSPREFLCPSDAEENAALYNMACCYAQMGQTDAALTCVDAVLENGFADVQTMMSDPDLAPLRGPQLQQLVDKYTGMQAKVMGMFKRKEPEIVSDPNENRPWWEVRW
ncbi:MAG: hypothetical protein J3K34DRAFT_109787 [Monoraphidium minutum]|nr:MAG: hypothetical protein J3K34DRAFT_109787 [Monoraphidium minutum]